MVRAVNVPKLLLLLQIPHGSDSLIQIKTDIIEQNIVEYAIAMPANNKINSITVPRKKGFNSSEEVSN